MRVYEIDVEAERTKFRRYAEQNGRFNSNTYSSDETIDDRTNLIVHTFDRVLRGRGQLPKTQKEAEKHKLFQQVRREFVHPLLDRYDRICDSQAAFDQWHRQAMQTIKATCPYHWDGGSVLTVGMIQKIVNLHCKSLWTLALIPDRCTQFFHATIDKETLEELLDRKGFRWTKMDSYETYLQLQLELRQSAEQKGTYTMALETWNWSKSLIKWGRMGGRER